jgi:hypothetical protein
MSREEWPVRRIRLSSETPWLASIELKLWRSEWNLRGGEIPGALAFDDRERAQPQSAGRALGPCRSESIASFRGAWLMWVYFRWMSVERWPVSFIRISSETHAFTKTDEKL